MASKSIMQNEKRCYLCGRYTDLEKHHCIAGPNRKWAEKYGCWVYLCHDCHLGKGGAQYDRDVGQRLKAEAQLAFERIHDHELWMKVFMKNYL